MENQKSQEMQKVIPRFRDRFGMFDLYSEFLLKDENGKILSIPKDSICNYTEVSIDKIDPTKAYTVCISTHFPFTRYPKLVTPVIGEIYRDVLSDNPTYEYFYWSGERSLKIFPYSKYYK